eukprot:5457801-Prymnesium_polylepis.2
MPPRLSRCCTARGDGGNESGRRRAPSAAASSASAAAHASCIAHGCVACTSCPNFSAVRSSSGPSTREVSRSGGSSSYPRRPVGAAAPQRRDSASKRRTRLLCEAMSDESTSSTTLFRTARCAAADRPESSANPSRCITPKAVATWYRSSTA